MPSAESTGRGLHCGPRKVNPSAAIYGCAGTTLSAAERDFFADANPFGFIFFARNVDTPEQVAGLCDQLRSSSGRNAPILIDQEGGRVQRLRAPHWREFPPAMRDAAHPEADTILKLRYHLIAHELSTLGIDVNCAPLLDVPVEGAHDVIGERALARDAKAVARLGHAVRAGLAAGGILPVIKHIPGHGRSKVDTHHDLDRVTDARTVLELDFAPFREHADALLGMTAHLVYEAIDQTNCGTMSAAVIDLIRRDIGFDGLLMTDDISMGALSGTVAERASRALTAGCDIVLHCNGDLEEMTAIAAEAGALSGASADRAKAVDAAPRTRADVDIAEIEHQYKSLTMERADA